MKKKQKISNNFYFLLCLRGLSALFCIIILFCIGLSQYWTNRVSAIFGLLFVIITLLFVISSISILFIWDIKTTTIVKRCIFTFFFSLAILISGIMFIIANDGCDPRMLSANYGCYQTVSTGTYQVSIAFCFITLVFGLADIGLNCWFYYRNEKQQRNPVYDIPPTPISTIHKEKPTIHDLYMEYHRQGQQTSV